MTNPPQNIEQTEKTLRIVWLAMMAGVLTIAGVGYVVGQRAEPPANAEQIAMILVVVGLSMAAPAVAMRVQRDRVFDGAKDPQAALDRYRTFAVMTLAMSESVGMLGGVALLMGLPLYVAAVLVPLSLGMLVINVPSPRGGYDRLRA